MTDDVRRALAAKADAERAKQAQRFFKTGPGEYGESDTFLGVTVPAQREVARAHSTLPVDEALALLESPIHEERLTALFILVRHFERGDAPARQRIHEGYLARTRHLNNWDLVDSSAAQLVGGWVLKGDRRLLRRLARSQSLWENRIAIIACLALIRAGEAEDTLAIARVLLTHEHDLIHKATGWMLREVGGRVDVKLLRAFLAQHAATMPRTMLRYAIEKLPPPERKRWLSERREAARRRRP
jgi:3-methyladenine DNA glycosylase AlkD